MIVNRNIGETRFLQLNREFISEMKTLFKMIQDDSQTIINKAEREKWSYEKLENELASLFEGNNEQENEFKLELQTIQKASSKALSDARLKGKYQWRGKKYRTLIKKILVENQEKIAESVLTTDKKRLANNIKEMLPKTKRGKIVKLPNVSNVIRRSSSIIKAADNGELMSDSRRDDMRKIIKSILLDKKIDTRQGTVKPSILKEVESKLGEYFETYTKNSPPYGVPKNLYNIAVTETRSFINNVKKEYMNKVSDDIAKDGFRVQKYWKHNTAMVRKKPRKNHLAMNNKPADKNGFFEFIDFSGRKIKIENPHDIKLQPEDTITCHCEVIYRIVRVYDNK